MTERKEISPPGGMPPPAEARLSDGTVVALEPLAEQVADRHLARFPDELERYGPAGRAWCVHDNQHLLNWAVLDGDVPGMLLRQVRWLAGVLSARGYPLDRLAADLETAAEAIRPQLDAAADALLAAAEDVRSTSA